MTRTVRRPWLILTQNEIASFENTIWKSNLYPCSKAGEYFRRRDYTVFKLMRLTGLRPGEDYNLEWSQIDLKKRVIYIEPYSNKQREGDTLKLTKEAIKLILDWAEYVRSFLISKYVFICLNTLEPGSTSYFAKRYNRIAKEAGVHKIIGYTLAGQPISNVRPYSERKAYGKSVYKESQGDIILTIKALRQRRISSALPYTDYSDEEVIERFDKIFKNRVSGGALPV